MNGGDCEDAGTNFSAIAHSPSLVHCVERPPSIRVRILYCVQLVLHVWLLSMEWTILVCVLLVLVERDVTKVSHMCCGKCI